MADLFSTLSPEDQAKTKAWVKKRIESKYERDIPTGLYIAAELGYYYGWQAVVDYRRGYHEGISPEGKPIRHPFTMSEAVGFIEAAKKVHYRQMIDMNKANAAAHVSSHDPEYAKRNAEYVTRMQEKAFKN